MQILLESLPISSSGHLLLLQRIFNLQHIEICSKSFVTQELQSVWSSIMHLMHVPTVIILTIFFFDIWFSLLKRLYHNHEIIIRLIVYAAIADFVTVVWYMLFSYISVPVSLLPIGFLITGLLLIVQQYAPIIIDARLSWKKCLLLGCAQGIAFFPGVSRFAIVYAVARFIGFVPRKAFAIVWMIFVPLIIASSFVEICSIWNTPAVAWLVSKPMFITVSVSTLISYYLLSYAYRQIICHRFWIFGLYMLAISGVASGVWWYWELLC